MQGPSPAAFDSADCGARVVLDQRHVEHAVAQVARGVVADLLGVHLLEAEHLLVELGGALQVLDLEREVDDAAHRFSFKQGSQFPDVLQPVEAPDRVAELACAIAAQHRRHEIVALGVDFGTRHRVLGGAAHRRPCDGAACVRPAGTLRRSPAGWAWPA